MKKYNIYYIPWDKLMGEDPASHTQWMVVYADTVGEAKQSGKKDGLVVDVSINRRYDIELS